MAGSHRLTLQSYYARIYPFDNGGKAELCWLGGKAVTSNSDATVIGNTHACEIDVSPGV